MRRSGHDVFIYALNPYINPIPFEKIIGKVLVRHALLMRTQIDCPGSRGASSYTYLGNTHIPAVDRVRKSQLIDSGPERRKHWRYAWLRSSGPSRWRLGSVIWTLKKIAKSREAYVQTPHIAHIAHTAHVVVKASVKSAGCQQRARKVDRIVGRVNSDEFALLLHHINTLD